MPTTNPAKAEALNDRVQFEWRGETFTVLTTEDWPFEAMEAFEDGKLTHFLREILGTKEYQHFKSLNPKVSDLNEFVDEVQAALGISGK